jgi:hypothetical protein
MYNYRPIGVYAAKTIADKERENKNGETKNDKTFLQFANNIVKETSNIKTARLKEFYDQIVKNNGELLVVDDDIKKIYIKLLNFEVSQKGLERLKEIGGSVQFIGQNNGSQSKTVNMDYFSVRIDKMPNFGNKSTITDIYMLLKKIRDNFFILSKGTTTFESYCRYLNIEGK